MFGFSRNFLLMEFVLQKGVAEELLHLFPCPGEEMQKDFSHVRREVPDVSSTEI